MKYLKTYKLFENTDERLQKDWLPPFLYHVTPTENENEIKKNGVKPSEGGRTFLHRHYTPRVYMATSLIAAYDLQVNFHAHDSTKYVIFKIDTKKIPSDEFYDDDKFVHGVWSPDSIPSDAIVSTIDPDRLQYDEKDLEDLYDQDWHDYDEPEPIAVHKIQ